MSNHPDFIVDPSGTVRDVRHSKSAQEPAHAAPQRPATPPPSIAWNIQGKPQSAPKPNRKPYFIVIPIGLILFLIGKFLGVPATNNATYHAGATSFNMGNYYYDKGDYDQAIFQFNLAIYSEPGFGEAYNNRGLAYYAKGDDEHALSDFETAIRLMPGSALPLSNRGLVYLHKADYEKAIVDFSQALERNPRFAKAFFNRGLAYFDSKNYDNAISDFDKAIEFTPEEIFTVLNKVPAGKNPLSRDLINSLDFTQQYADLPSVYVYRGIAYLDKSNYEMALADFEKAIQLRPDSALAYYSRGLAYYSMGDDIQAIADFKKVLELNNDSTVQQEAELRLNELGEE
jgi:tetratricopeptide (TPR) repeat protein